MLHKDYGCKSSAAKQEKSLVVSLKGLGAELTEINIAQILYEITDTSIEVNHT
jgi:hypothetical protein